ncbi:hypothetical protein GGR57DRAFT_35273 [Xylariaceae sp. FL1272]|nr:hypothetical protein GGR57DRAFT_35273 [Xylariaceae sp. FL1272]
MAALDINTSQWPMSYASRAQPESIGSRRFFHYYYYRSPSGQKVQVQYSQTKALSEAIAKTFVNEPVLGFDMEWPWDSDKRSMIKEKVALIQLASERRVGLFHISLHAGNTTEELIAPTLRKIIESPNILKTGVAIMNADFKRLKAHFGLEPKGAFELSHLHNLVTHGPSSPEQCTTKLRSLSSQVEAHLGMPLWKGNTRTSDWSRPLNPSQIQYAADDAYAGFMLFHCMNAKRLKMDPVPPPPRRAETYLPFPMSKVVPIRLDTVDEKGEASVITATNFFGVSAIKGQTAEENIEGHDSSSKQSIDANAEGNKEFVNHVLTRLGQLGHILPGPVLSAEVFPPSSSLPRPKKRSKPERALMDASTQALYNRLVAHRKGVAVSKKIPPYCVAHDSHLQDIATCLPRTTGELLLVHGIGKAKVGDYGAAWLDIIAEFVAERKRLDHREPDQSPGEELKLEAGGICVGLKRNRVGNVGRSKELILPSDAPPHLSTGLSFDFSRTNLETDEDQLQQLSEDASAIDADSDDGSEFAPPMELPSPSTLKRKRALTLPSEPESEDHQSKEAALFPTLEAVSTMDIRSTVHDTPPTKQPHRLNCEPEPTATTATPAPAPVQNLIPQTPSRSNNFETAMLRKKLEAYIKSVVSVMQTKPTSPLASEHTLQCLVLTIPRTPEEFHRVPGISVLLQACKAANRDIWRSFEMWTRGPAFASSR